MRESRNISASIALLTGVALLASCFGVAKNAKYWRTISEYKAATPLHLTPVPNASSNCREWRFEYKLPNGVRASVQGSNCGPGSTATVKYSDEIEGRYIYKYFDYVYPAAMRIQGNVLYTLVAGQTVFGNAYQLLIVYDLATRTKLREVKIDPKDLPVRAW